MGVRITGSYCQTMSQVRILFITFFNQRHFKIISIPKMWQILKTHGTEVLYLFTFKSLEWTDLRSGKNCLLFLSLDEFCYLIGLLLPCVMKLWAVSRSCFGSESCRGSSGGFVTPSSFLDHISYNLDKRQWCCHSHILRCWGFVRILDNPQAFWVSFVMEAFCQFQAWCPIFCVCPRFWILDGQLNWNCFSFLFLDCLQGKTRY